MRPLVNRQGDLGTCTSPSSVSDPLNSVSHMNGDRGSL
jgi:hypothetical protein